MLNLGWDDPTWAALYAPPQEDPPSFSVDEMAPPPIDYITALQGMAMAGVPADSIYLGDLDGLLS